MADGQDNASKIFTLFVKPGIKRDGTRFEGDQFSDGRWVRFQRGKAKKINGYRQMFATPYNIPRGIITNPYNGVNYVFVGNREGIEVFNTGTDQGVGVGPFQVEFSNTFVVTAVNSGPVTIEVVGNVVATFPTGTTFWAYNTSGLRTNYTTTGTPTYNSGTNRTTITLTSLTGFPTPATTVEIYLPITFPASDEYLWQFDIAFDSTGEGNSKLLAHPGKNLSNIDSGVVTSLYAGNFLPDAATQKYVLTQVVDSSGTSPTYQPINVSGGVVVLYPFIFAYSNFGNLRNNNVTFTPGSTSVQTFSDWNGPLANDTNMTAGKIVRGFPVRGGTASPSGIFWSTDSLLRVSFTATSPYYWRYDTIATQISIMSSNAVTEMDGIFYWMGSDRFYIYNGAVKVLPNDKNVNYLFDNLNFEQRQKVWATKVPRFNELWWFYPRGTSTECNDAIIYNVKDDIWYDAGEAAGARRSCGYMTEVFPRPIWCAWEPEFIEGISYELLYGPGNGSPATSTKQVIVAGDLSTNPPGSYMFFQSDESTVNQIVSATFTNDTNGGTTLITFVDTLDPTLTTGSTMAQITGGYQIWEHEFGKNKITATEEYAIESFAETSDISWIGGTPAEDHMITANRRMHITRIEPDFNQVGDMTMTIVGRPFAQSPSVENDEFTFTQDDGKIDMRVEHRLINLRWKSNVIDGDYEAGRIMITAEMGDERP
jgi:hypothetical protein